MASEIPILQAKSAAWQSVYVPRTLQSQSSAGRAVVSVWAPSGCDFVHRAPPLLAADMGGDIPRERRNLRRRFSPRERYSSCSAGPRQDDGVQGRGEAPSFAVASLSKVTI